MGKKISDICLKQGQGMRGRAAPPQPRIHRVPPPPPGGKITLTLHFPLILPPLPHLPPSMLVTDKGSVGEKKTTLLGGERVIGQDLGGGDCPRFLNREKCLNTFGAYCR